MSVNLVHDNSQQFDDALAMAKTLVPLNGLRESYLADLFNHVSVQTILQGQVLFQFGQIDNQHIYLLHGEVHLQTASGEVVSVATEDSILPLAHAQPRQQRGVAITDCMILRVDSDYLDRMVCWSQISDYLLAELCNERDMDEDMEWIQTVLKSNLFYKVPPINVEMIFDRLKPVVVIAGDAIIRQGELGDACYFIKEGEAEVTQRSESGKLVKLADINVGRCFGEDALVNETVRNANVTMKTDGVLMVLNKQDFLLLRKEPVVEEVTENEAASMLQSPVYVDVRTDEEYNLGHLSFSANIPLGLLSLKKRLLDPAKPYVFYCDTGRRSRAAAYLLGKQGYNAMALAGGFIEAGLSENLVQEAGYMLRHGELVAGAE
ncbi:cyclic nucleotide-binding domain-containing protein [Saccharophagus degradans]|uniref:Cyclic nucleotide-binding domain-containing protein n=1 Tax=Saccharophagus degradans TaxID=86304 RepID=A0AAW7XBS9_9GAMM|nr:cyclic nucleotide-binding domain-containing protein [Saccharophagus degradans]MBU2984148.1 cyclic nucleotide-binding domain-containing protein [Saccharophagus degradans]MDO6424193.1 cyclic nucleotide-binding domain-containing protein [Saccharophagus degradans]MDO6608240.1 cyclic nucleotide-binding domain-containing protein [Saccharophagus degradans]